MNLSDMRESSKHTKSNETHQKDVLLAIAIVSPSFNVNHAPFLHTKIRRDGIRSLNNGAYFNLTSSFFINFALCDCTMVKRKLMKTS